MAGTVLVVEDTASELELISSYLRKGGYTVVAANNAAEALQKLTDYKPDVVVTDLVMPEMNGFEFLRKLKESPNTEKLPVVVCSSKNQEIDRLWAMKQGADAYVTKPFTEEALLRSVKSVAV